MSDAGPSRAEKKAFLRVLSCLAWADGEVKTAEMEVLHMTASDLGVALGERDLDEEWALSDLAGQVTHPELQARLLEALGELARADDEVAPEELSTIKFFAAQFALDPPEVPGVDWKTVVESLDP
jgi:uncharacterized tellurite resistance protein B-like protein